MNARPVLDRHLSVDDFRSCYSLKDELSQFCRDCRVSPSGSKLALAARIEQVLAGASVAEVVRPARPRRSGRIATGPLSLDTVITEHYTNSQVNRAFFESVIGPSFHFTTNFMRFCRENVGRTYRDAVAEWHREHESKKIDAPKAQLAPQFQYNQYIRDYMGDNPGRAMRDAIAAWNKKKQRWGTMKYERADVE